MKFKLALLMQYLVPNGFGPSSKTWPKCPSQVPHRTSILSIPNDSSLLMTISFVAGWVKAGHPHPLTNFSFEVKRSELQPTHRYSPSSVTFQKAFVNGLSVPFSLKTRNCSGERICRHSLRLFLTDIAIKLYKGHTYVLLRNFMAFIKFNVCFQGR